MLPYLYVCAEFAAKGSIAAPVKAHFTDVTITPVIPQSPDDIIPIIHNIVDKFWECRRYGESWDSRNPSPWFFDDCDGDGLSIEAVTRRMHRRLVFDLVTETLTEIYRGENDDSISHSHDVGFTSKLATVRPQPPTMLDSLKPYVESHVLRQLKLRDVVPPPAPRWSSRRRQDAVDWLLVKELGEIFVFSASCNLFIQKVNGDFFLMFARCTYLIADFLSSVPYR